MGINESGGRLPREKWPLSFDLEGVPRDRDAREDKLKEFQIIAQDILQQLTEDKHD